MTIMKSLKITLLTLGIFLSLSLTKTFAQTNTFKVSGTVVDSTKSKLRQASVSVLKMGNNVLTGFGFSNADGFFEVKNIKAGEYTLQITYVGKQTLRRPFKIEDKDVSLGEILLYDFIADATGATITADRNPITVKKDTLEYDARAFATRPNANVEELLKKLPGVEVATDGKVTAMGKEVTKVLVDGKDFFGKDPKQATRNLDADIIERVQVLDERSDMSRMTGIDDGERERVINLALKADKKKGYFGKLEAGYGTEGRYDNQLSANRFNRKMQFSVVGNLNNVNRQNFTRGEGMSVSVGGGGVRMATTFSSGNSSGLSTTQSGGINFNYDFTKNLKLNSSYSYGSVLTETDRAANQQQLLGAGNSFRLNDVSFQSEENNSHRVNARINYNPSEGNELIVRGSFSLTDGALGYDATQNTFNAQEVKSVYGTRDEESTSEGVQSSAQVTYRHRLGKVGRNIVFNGQFSNNTSDKLSFLETLDQYYLPAKPDIVLDQEQNSKSDVLNYQGTITYTEPITLKSIIETNYTYRNNQNDQDQQVFDLITGQKTVNELLTNLYNNDYKYHIVGTRYNYRVTDWNVNFGVKVQSSQLEGISQKNPTVTKSFTNFLPELNFNFNAPQSANLRLNYSTRVREPSVRELQPVADNRNPQNIYIGNPNLNNEYAHNLNLNFFKFDMFTQTNTMAFINASYTLNKITNEQIIGENFKQTTTPFNSDKENWSIMGFGNYGKPIRPLKIKFSLNLSSRFNRSYTLINKAENQTNTINNSFGLSLDNIRKETLDIRVGGQLSQNISRYSLNTDQNRNYFTPAMNADLSLYLGQSKEWTIGSNFRYVQYPATSLAEASSISILEARISRRILNDKAIIELAGYDLLDQNSGFNRTESTNVITDETVKTLGRHVLMRFTYSFRTFGK